MSVNILCANGLLGGNMKHIKIIAIFVIIFVATFQTTSYAGLTEKQANDIALFAQKFIEKGNNRIDEKGYPLITYALTGNWGTNVIIRSAGYNEQLYCVKNIAYYKSNGVYKNLGDKWCMDCGTFVSYILKVTLGFDMYNNNEPWHVQDMYDDASKKDNKYFYYIYKQTPLSKIDYADLEIGDIVAKVTSEGNHVMLYIGNGLVAHTNGDLITYKKPYVSGFTISKLDEYYSASTKINILRIRDGIVPEDYVVNSRIVWPDTGEEEYILGVPMSTVSRENVQFNFNISFFEKLFSRRKV